MSEPHAWSYTPSVPPDVDISWLSDCVLRIAPRGGGLQDESIARAWNIADAIRASAIRASAIRAAAIDGVAEVTLAYAGVQVRVRERVAMDAHAAAAVEARVRAAVDQAAGASKSSGAARRVVEVPVCYDTAVGLDLEWLARESGLSVDEVIALHAGATYYVHFLGFLPGFAYMGGVPEVLRVPRHSSPRTRVAAGSVAIAGAQAGIYPSDTPGGWRIVGRTPRAVFDPSREVPSLLQPGDEVRFVRIDRARFDELAATARPRDGART